MIKKLAVVMVAMSVLFVGNVDVSPQQVATKDVPPYGDLKKAKPGPSLKFPIVSPVLPNLS